jgi:hypothetical protein
MALGILCLVAIIPGAIFPSAMGAKAAAVIAGLIIGGALLGIAYPGSREKLAVVVTEKAIERRGPTGIVAYCPLDIIEAVSSVRMPDGNHVLGFHITKGQENRVTIQNKALTPDGRQTFRTLYDADFVIEGKDIGSAAESVRRYMQGASGRDIELSQMVHQDEMDYQSRREIIRTRRFKKDDEEDAKS